MKKIVNKELALYLAVGALVLLALCWFGRDAGEEIEALEAWVAGLGNIGLLVFIVIVVALTSFFMPTTVLSVVSGALFGLGWGAFAMIAGCVLGAALDYVIASTFFRARIAAILQRYPKLLVMQRAVQQRGMHVQFMLRLTPISPVLVNYALGSAGVRFLPYLLASAGLIPGLFVEVYFGHVAKHVTSVSAGTSSHSTAHTVVTIGGLVLCVLVMIRIGSMARRVLEEAGAMPEEQPGEGIA
jgi:uncharacterized membrane protein YdjX (TVP38/TMEM64 family)